MSRPEVIPRSQSVRRSNKVNGIRTKDERKLRTELASLPLSEATRKALDLTIPVKIYVQDPLVAKRNKALGRKTIEVAWEPDLADGPTSARIAIVDYDADTDTLTPPARWSQARWAFLSADGKPVSGKRDSDPHFRQVNVWAIVHSILGMYESPSVMGRPIPWAFEGNRLIVVPGAGCRQNAFYDRHSKSLLFFYCGQERKPVYTCLSHDIVAHETGHAILDGIRPHYYELSSTETAAFHEFVADLTAILSALHRKEVRKVVATRSGGDLSSEGAWDISDLAEEFGQEVTMEAHGAASRCYLRTAANKCRMSDIKASWSPHDCSQVMTGAVFDILTEMVRSRSSRTGKGGRKMTPTRALWPATDHLTRMALRALDYCPPVDVQFNDYARAMLRADEIIYPNDTNGYRAIIRRVFKKRGLNNYVPSRPPYAFRFRRYDISRLAGSHTAAYHFLHENREFLGIPREQDIVVSDLYDTDKRGALGTKPPREIILEYTWREEVKLKGAGFGPLNGQVAPLLCGGTLVFDGRGNVLSLERKPGLKAGDQDLRSEGERRQARLLKYIAHLVKTRRVTHFGAADDRIGNIRTPVTATREEGMLRLEATPHLRHTGYR
jgi:hypothetical protein